MRLRSLTFFLITASLTFLVNLTSLLYLAFRQKVAKVTQDTQTRLFVFTIALFGCHVLLVAEQCIYVYCGYVNGAPWMLWITAQYPYFCDLETLAPAILLLATSTKLRGHVFRPVRKFLLHLIGVEASSKSTTVIVTMYKTRTNPL
ncbi:unnamed protein product [Bursaphelenchus xylophilus]|uniref:(pine wood nematode) hypothetical protein n=1 Tax=Bursaphelenchus xylophilus TaxID=6326 RepID=A0A1I7RTC4_BURXY|nr:unnamed protein product [Bursaphelenchus xylophilus]CAG9122504.1 unnamed protein product [Bursaphelenchus xylophilus]